MKYPAIDVHAHFGIYDSGIDCRSDRFMSADPEAVIRRARAAGVKLTLVSACKALMPFGAGNPVAGNQEAREASEKYPELGFWAVLNPLLPESWKQVEELVTHPRCAGIKIHPSQHQYDIRDQGGRIFEFAARNSAIISSHSGEGNSAPERFVPFLNDHPEVVCILAHLGHSEDDRNFSRQVWVIQNCKSRNVFVDTSSSKSLYPGLIEWAVREIGSNRILFGTDTPCYFTASQKARIEYAEVVEKDKLNILYNNARKILGRLFRDRNDLEEDHGNHHPSARVHALRGRRR